MLIRAPRGREISCRGWPQEGVLRLLLNTLDPEVAERPQDLIVYGGTGKAARNWEALAGIIRALQELGDDETLVIQSGKAVAAFPTHPLAPRVIMANSFLVPAWATWPHFWELEKKGLTMYGQSTAAAWAYIGTQGILEGTYETMAAVARTHFGGTLAGRRVLTSGLGAMGRAQPLAVTLNGGVIIVVEANPETLKQSLRKEICQVLARDVREAWQLAEEACRKGEPLAIGILGNAAEIYPEMVKSGLIPDVVTDQTAAHDPLNGYLPAGLSFTEALELRRTAPAEYVKRSLRSMAVQVQAMLDLQKHGAVVFEYGNNLRAQVAEEIPEAFRIPGFVQAYIRPLLAQGRGPFRWVALSGEPADIFYLDEVIRRLFPEDEAMQRWIRHAQSHVWFQGLPARIGWLNFEERIRFALEVNKAVQTGQVAAPVAITRDHLDAGAIASPRRETEGLPDGSDAIADWPILNALLNASNGATLVGLHHGGGVGIGHSVHAGMTVVVDGSAEAETRLERVFTGDVGLGLVRYYDAGLVQARSAAQNRFKFI